MQVVCGILLVEFLLQDGDGAVVFEQPNPSKYRKI